MLELLAARVVMLAAFAASVATAADAITAEAAKTPMARAFFIVKRRFLS
ncbi:hypothetical protein [Microtetraspora malaysiensis]